MTRTVTDSTPYESIPEMSVFGYLVAAGIAVILLPLLPILLVGWLLVRLLGLGQSVE